MIKRDRIPFVQIENTVIEKKLSAYEIAVYLALCIRSNIEDETWPSYPTIAKNAGMSRMTAVRTVEKLLQKGLIEKVKRGEQSNLYIVKLIGGSTTQILPDTAEVLPSTCEILEVVPERDSNNNQLNKNNEQEPMNKKDTLPYKEIIEYLNLKVNTAYRATTPNTQKLIRARINEGFTLEDFKSVIDIKAKEWGSDSEWKIYLRPVTLFGTKFESYLQQGAKTKSYKDMTVEEKQAAGYLLSREEEHELRSGS